MATITVNAGDTSTGKTLTGDIMQVYGTAENTKVKTDGQLNVYNGGSANNTTVSAGGAFTVSNGGIATSTTVKQNGSMTVVLGGNATSTTVNEGGTAAIAGNATSTTLSGGTLYISNGGVATIATVKTGGTMHVSNGAQATSATVTSGGITIFAGGAATSTTVKSNGEMTVAQNATATGTTATDGGTVKVQGQVTGTVLSGSENNAYLHVSDGGQAMLTTVDYNGYLYVSNGGQATSTTVKEDGRMYVSDGGKVTSTTVNHNGFLYVSNGGSVNDTVVSGGLYVSNGGSVNGVDVKTGGCLYLDAGAKATGMLTFAAGATVEAETGATIDFDISGLSPENAVLVNNLSLVTGSPAFTITVDDSQTLGTYRLADGATSFNGTITVKNTSGTELGTITVGETKGFGSQKYTLTLTDGSLGVTVVERPPDLTGDLTSEYDLNAGEVGSIVNVDDGGKLIVKDGGVANQTTVNSNGSAKVYKGGSADVVTVNFGGKLYVRSGGSATKITENGGYVSVDDGATVEFVPNSFGGYSYNNANDRATLHSGTTGTDLTVANDGGINVYSGGIADVVTVSSGGKLYVSAGGTATKITENGGYVGVWDGATVEFVPNSFDGITLEEWDYATVHSGTTATDTVINSGCSLDVSNGGQASQTTVNSGGNLYVFSGGTADVVTVNSGGIYVFSGGTADVVTVNFGGNLYVRSGGSATKITENGGYVSVDDGATVEFVPNSFGGITLEKWKYATVHSGTTATDTVINSGGRFFVYAGGSATGIVAADGADLLLTVAPNTYAQGTYAGSAFEITDTVADYTIYFGTLEVAEGGKADAVTIDYDCSLFVSSNGLATTTTVNSGGMFVFHSGQATDTTVNEGGELYVEEDGLTDKTTVNSGGKLIISSGGKATKITENGGYVSVETGATAEFVAHEFTGVVLDNDNSATVHSGTTATDTVINGGGELRVYDGLANNTVVRGSDDEVGCLMGIDGTLNGVTVESGGGLALYGGKLTGKITVESGGELALCGGKLTGKITLENGAYFGVADFDFGQTLDFDLTQTAPGADALVNDLFFHKSTSCLSYTLTIDGSESAGSYKLAENAADFDKTITVMSDDFEIGTLTVGGGKTTIDGRDYTLTLTDGLLAVTLGERPVNLTGDLNTYYDLGTGKYASSVNILDGGKLFVYKGGLADKTTVNAKGNFCVFGGRATDTTVNENGCMYVSDDGTADDVTISSGGTLYVSSGGTATEIHWTPCEGEVAVYDGGYATFVNSYSGVYYGEGGKLLSNTAVMDGKSLDYTRRMLVMNNGTATNTNVTNYGALDVRSGGTAIDTTVVNGFVYVSSGGIAISTTVGDNSFLTIFSGGVTADATVNAGGKLNVSAGGKVTGKITFETGAKVTAETGAEIDFDLTQTTPGADPLVNDLSFVMDKNFTYTLTVGTSQKLGTYKLAEGADGFDKTITVMVNDFNLGTITVAEGRKTLYAMDYTLTLSDGVLSVTLDDVATDTMKPTVSNVAADITGPTKDNVTVTADFSDDVALKSSLYKINDGAWQDYTGGVVVTDNNTTITFKAVDTSDNESDEASITITNIDKVKPTISDIAPSTTEPTTSVTVTATFDDNVGVATKQYKIGEGDWTDYTTGVTVTTNTTVYFKAVDTAGNEETAQYVVTNIETSSPDTTKPTVTNVAADITGPTKDNVTVTADFNDDVEVKSKLYKINDGAWQDYTGGVVVTDNNTTITFKAVDTSDNESNEASITITNIDKVKPTITGITPSTTEPAASVTVTATFDDNVGVATQQYKIGEGSWQDYTTGVTVTENVTVSFKATDTAGNESTDSYDVTNIINPDHTPPTITITPSTTEPGVASVTLTAVFDDNVGVTSSLYKLKGDMFWSAYPEGGVTVTENMLVQFKATDEAGNETITGYDVTNIITSSPDTTKPTITVTADTTEPTTSVTLTAVFDDDVGVTSKQYRVGDGEWKDYSAPIPITENVTVGFRATDAVGNEATENFTVTNIENEPENNWLFKKNKKKYEWNLTENITAFSVNEVASGNSMVFLDKKGSVESEDGKYFNSLSRVKTESGETIEDAADYAKIELAYGAALQFSVDSTVGGTFYVYEKTKDKNDNDIATQRQKITVKANKTSPAKLTTIYLKAGEYFVGMEGKLPSARNTPEFSAYYNVQLTDTKYFENVDGGWNDSVYAVGTDGKEDKTKLDPTLEAKALVLERGVTDIKLDDGADGTDDWVGFSDAADYRMLTLEDKTNLTLSLSVTGKETGKGKAKLTIWKVSTGKGGKITLSSKGSIEVKQDATGLIKSKVLDKGTYFVSVTSSDAKKGGDVSYNVKVDEKTVFFDSADNSFNNVLYNKKGKAFYGEDETHHFETTTVNGAGIHVKLDSDPVGDTNYENFVGYQDAADYAKIELASDGNLSFDLKATGNATFVVYKKDQDKKGNDTLVAIQTTKLTLAKDKDIVETGTDLLTGLKAGEYYVSMTAKSTKANASGSVFYSVMATLDSSVSSALAMPETDTLGISDALSFGGYDTDALADASASALADLDDKTGWLNIASLA